MHFNIKTIPHTLFFRNPVGTSRGIYQQHKVWYIVLTSPSDRSRYGMGECAPLPGLSYDDMPEKQYAQILTDACRHFSETEKINTAYLKDYPSILFGLETALLHYNADSLQFMETPFSRGEEGITINGLIWMGKFDFMLQQIEQKLEQGFRCIKIKIGAINFDKELELLQFIRSRFSSEQVSLRVDANGAFDTHNALDKLEQLTELDLHSIEQPIKAGQWGEMAKLTKEAPLPIALDEELIGYNSFNEKQQLLETIRPHYIVLKPSLHGGLSGCNEWIEIANSLNIGWWATSALESNIGLNAIAQWCGSLDNSLPQGLGTGMLYTNNIDLPISIKGDELWFDATSNINHIKDFFHV